MPKPRSPFRRDARALKLVAKGEAAELHLYDEIGFWGVMAKDFVQELKGIVAETIHLRINSPGGDVFDGLAMFNALREHPARIVTHVDGLAASMASVIALAGDEVHMAENAFLMIHHPWAITIGNAGDHRKQAETLDKIGDSLVKTYVSQAQSRDGADADQVRTWMDEETWFTAEEAKEAGFADVVEESQEVEARFDLSCYRNAPEPLAPQAPTKRNLEKTLRDAGYSRTEAKKIAASIAPSLRDADEDGLHAVNTLLATIQPGV